MKIVTIFWILLAVLCGGYGILIRAIGSGTGFFLVWIALAVIFVGCSAAAQAGLWGIMPQFLRRVTLVLLGLILVLFTGIGGCIGSKMNTEGKRTTCKTLQSKRICLQRRQSGSIHRRLLIFRSGHPPT